MSWVGMVIAVSFLTLILAGVLFLVFWKQKGVGNDFIRYSEKPAKKVAPKVYYHKQVLYRKYYGIFIGVHIYLTLSSVILTLITVYMIMDDSLEQNTRIAVSVLAAITSVLQLTLQLGKKSEGYVLAVRILEQAILEYEQEEADLKKLLEANIEAEKVIHNFVQ